MRLVAVATALACLAGGCTYTPEQVRSEGWTAEHALKLPPRQAAGCISRNAENYLDSITTLIRDLPTPGSMEVVIRVGGVASVMVDIWPDGAAAKGKSYNMLIWPGQREEFLAHMVKGC
jgi:hypothetical protein